MLLYLTPLLVVLSSQAAIIPNSVAEQLARLNASISDETCSFYTELERLLPCGDNGYVLQFAYHYCQVYLQRRNDFIERTWQDVTRRCLQEKMHQFVTQQSSYPSCKSIKQTGLDSHPVCYEKPDASRPKLSFCHIPLRDKLRVAWLASSGALLELLRGAAQLKFCL